MLSFYAYKGCDSCRKARKWLEAHNIEFQEFAIRETPPSLTELQFALNAQNSLKVIFNTSGMDYRKLGLKDKLAKMSDAKALELLASNGNLIKRPFLIDLDQDVQLTGFKENLWSDTLMGE